MKSACLCVLLVTAFAVIGALAAIGGCDGDNSSGSVLAQGTTNVTTGATVLVTVTVTEPGTLRGTIAWSGSPTEMEAGFKHMPPGTVIGLSMGSSPSTTTVAVTSARVAAGTEWQFLAAVPSGPDVSVQYEVTFEPE
jgi:hypothetical protein